MTHEERIAYVNAQTALMQVEMEGMLAENQHRMNCGESIAYGEDAFIALQERFEGVLGHNSLITLFHYE